jgi:hypothetical protein
MVLLILEKPERAMKRGTNAATIVVGYNGIWICRAVSPPTVLYEN